MFLMVAQRSRQLTLVFRDGFCMSLSKSFVTRMLGNAFLQLASYKRSIKEILETKEHYPNWKLQCSKKQFLWETRHFWIELFISEVTDICHEESK